VVRLVENVGLKDLVAEHVRWPPRSGHGVPGRGERAQRPGSLDAVSAGDTGLNPCTTGWGTSQGACRNGVGVSVSLSVTGWLRFPDVIDPFSDSGTGASRMRVDSAARRPHASLFE
jgi:hypothetical protein